MRRVKAIACVDMTMEPGKTLEQQHYIKDVVMQFQASKEALGTPIILESGINAVSAGHDDHDYAPGAAIDLIFNFFNIMACS